MLERWIAESFGGPEVLRLEESPSTPPAAGQVRVDVRACGLNPADFKHIAGAQDPRLLPLTIGFEASGVVAELGPGTAQDGLAVGDAVIVATISGAWATELTVDATKVFAKPATLTFEEAANLLLAGTTAADLIHVTRVHRGDVVLIHGGSGAVGISAIQQAVELGATVIGTCGVHSVGLVKQFGATPVLYGAGLLGRVREVAPNGVDVALDTVGSDEAGDVSLAVVPDKTRIATTAAFARAAAEGFTAVGSANPASGPFRALARTDIVRLAAEGKLRVPLGRTFPFAAAPDALALLMSHHPGGKIALATAREQEKDSK